jgi:carbamate kinase
LKESLLIAVGGNALLRAGQKGTIAEQIANAEFMAERITDLAEQGYNIIITHGNGPQVGSQLLRSELSSSQTYALPLDVCVAMTQGEIGFILQSALQKAFLHRGIEAPVAAFVTQVLVDENDPAFQHPTKPIGPFYSKETALKKQQELGWNIIEDAARGYRRVVASPKPISVLELDVIQKCIDANIVVIAGGGGGIPVIQKNGDIIGIEAVIDKDRASALLASQLRIQRMIISTEVEHVCLNFKKPGESPIQRMNVPLAKKLLGEGQFLEGSMKPKIEASIQFLDSGGEEVIITNPENILAALQGRSGTHIIKEKLHETEPHH